MSIEFHPSKDRGHANHGWLDTYHNFSFAEYFNPLREQFGLLRVLNDDTIIGGSGFGEHGHKNMEIISIPLIGELEHKDSMGHSEVISPEDVQVMSAGSGIQHSEFNHHADNPCNFLQIWIYTREKDIKPRYDQLSFNKIQRKNKVQLLVTPDTDQDDDALWIHQDAWISRVNLEHGVNITYKIHKSGNQVFCFLIEGRTTIEGFALGSRDALGIAEISRIHINSNAASDLLIIEVPSA